METVSSFKEKLRSLWEELDKLKAKGVSVDMTRGRPSAKQLEIAMPMLNAASLDFSYEGGDARNYGDLAGLPAARKLFGDLAGVSPSETVALDGSSLGIMYTLVQFAMQFGVRGGKPWNSQGKIKFLCPSPGYDRHFAICEAFGIKMITVPMRDDGPDMDVVEGLVSDPSVKGMWCVPKYSNPTGAIYSDSVVDRLASLKPAAADFRIFWDNAYCVHSLYGEDDRLKNIFDAAKACGNQDIVYGFVSTSKLTFAGSGVAAFVSSEANIADFLKRLQYKMINPNKVNQAMHVAFLKNADGVKALAAKHAELLRPKFELIEERMREAFPQGTYEGCDVIWSQPRGGYFISLNVKGCAKRIVELAKYAGVKLTPAGSTYPYRFDPNNANLRIAPSVPTLEEMDFAVDVVIVAIKIAILESSLAA